MSKNPQALPACRVGWPRAVQSMRQHALDDTVTRNEYKDRNLFVGRGCESRCAVAESWRSARLIAKFRRRQVRQAPAWQAGPPQAH